MYICEEGLQITHKIVNDVLNGRSGVEAFGILQFSGSSLRFVLRVEFQIVLNFGTFF